MTRGCGCRWLSCVAVTCPRHEGKVRSARGSCWSSSLAMGMHGLLSFARIVCCIGLSVLWRFGGKWQQRVTPVGLCHGLPATFLGSVSCASSRLEWRGALSTTLLGCFVLKNCVGGEGLITRSPKRTGPRRLRLHRHRCSIFQ